MINNRAHHNLAREVISLIQKLFLYLVGNLWLRIIGIVYLIKAALKGKQKQYLFILLVILISLSLPLFLLPNPDHYNAVQLGKVAMLLSAFFLGISLRKKPVAFFIVFLLIVPSSFRINQELVTISPQEREALEYLKENTAKNGVVLDLLDSHQSYMITPALAQRSVFFSDSKTANLIGFDYKKRLEIEHSILNQNPEKTKNFFQEESISYLLVKNNTLTKENQERLGLKEVFSNSELAVYSTKDF